jgi:hypothetical protein
MVGLGETLDVQEKVKQTRIWQRCPNGLRAALQALESAVVGGPVDALQVNSLSESENREIRQMLASIQSYIGIATDHEAKAVETPTEPAHIVQKIEDAMEKSATRPA